MNKWWRYGLWGVLVIAVLAAAHVAFWQRYMVEKDHNQVQLSLNYDEVTSLAGLKGLSAVEGLKEFKKHGITGVVLREPMLEDLRLAGDIQIYTGQGLVNLQSSHTAPVWLSSLLEKTTLVKSNTYILTFDKEIYEQLRTQMSAKLASVKTLAVDDSTYVIETTAPYIAIKELGAGFTRYSITDVQQAGMTVILQIRTWPGATQQSIDKVFASYRDIPGVSAVMFNEDTLPGYPSLLPELAAQIEEMHVPLVQVEFFPQFGFTKVGFLLDKNVVRLHTIPQNELKRLSPGEALDRYTLAAAERNHRILLIRPFLTGGDLLERNTQFIDQLSSRLAGEGLKVGTASDLPPVPVSRPLVLIIGLGVIAGGLLLLEKLRGDRLVPTVGAASVLLWVAVLYFDLVLARKLMSLVSVIIFPTLALISYVKREGLSPGAAVWCFIKISLFSLLGALFMVGMLADAAFMLKLDQFAGVKLAHVIPLLVVLLYFSLVVAKGAALPEKVKGLLNQPVLLGVALAGALMAVAMIVYVARTGNEAMTVSGLELQFRSLLDQILGVRPRTKEFLLGHPALLLVLLFGYRDNRFLPLLLLGAIGQASLVNTFAHIHTPLLVSLMRAFHGIWLGILLGLAVYFLIKLVCRYGREGSKWLKL
ncbi:MAG: DUF5693 family protein [Firmicutes bacterium]|nr:DUF5693 family protein [Bacillota bacterium]